MKKLANRVAIVTGAGSGIGQGIARRLAADGASVVIAEMNADTGDAVAQAIQQDFGVPASAFQVDMCDKAQVQAMVKHTVNTFGTVDILVNNAWAARRGARPFTPVEDKADEDFAHAFNIGYMAALWTMQAVFPYMRDKRWGRIINLASLNGVNAHPYTVDYNAAKEALRALTRTAAREWAQCIRFAAMLFAPPPALQPMRNLPQLNQTTPLNCLSLIRWVAWVILRQILAGLPRF